MKVFDSIKTNLIKEKIKIHREEAHKNGRFSLFDAKFAIDVFSSNVGYELVKWNYDMILSWDKLCNLPYDVGVSLDNYANQFTVMIHRTHLNLDTNNEGLTCNDVLYSIMNDGLKNFGHANAVGGGAFSAEPPPLTLTLTPLTGVSGYINLLSSYRDNDAIVIIIFPKNLVNENGEIINKNDYSKVYDLSENPPKVQKGFMAGAILKKSNGLDEFYTRDEFINFYNLNKSNSVNK